MSEELRPLSERTITDAIRVLNESTRGMSLECHVDFFGFLSLWRLWNFSPEYSLLRYVGDEPAAVILTSIDPEAHDAYAFYWGTLPEFRNQRIGSSLFEACCARLFEDGHTRLYATSAPDRPAQRYRSIYMYPQHDLVDMETGSPAPPVAEPGFQVRPIDIDAVSQVVLPPGESLHWSHRPSFLRNAGSCCRLFGAFAEGTLHAYMALGPSSSETALLDFRSPDSCLPAGHELLRWLLLHNYPAPFTAANVVAGNYAHRLLADAGFAIRRQFSMLSRDLRATCSTGTSHT